MTWTCVPSPRAALLPAVMVAVTLGLSLGHALSATARPATNPALTLHNPALTLHAVPPPHGPAPIRLPRVARGLASGQLRIVAFGSSSTQGIGASSPAASYPSQLQRDLTTLLPRVSVLVINQGIGGQDAVEFAGRLPGVLAARPDLVIFQTGTNDPLRGLPLPQFVSLTRQVVGRLRAAGIDVMLMEPQLCRVTMASPAAVLYRDAVRGVAADMRVPVIRRWDLMQAWLKRDVVTPVQMLAPDGLHMADAGYALLAREVAQEILADTR
jgi:lysophospholipase L1-like esterase